MRKFIFAILLSFAVGFGTLYTPQESTAQAQMLPHVYSSEEMFSQAAYVQCFAVYEAYPIFADCMSDAYSYFFSYHGDVYNAMIDYTQQCGAAMVPGLCEQVWATALYAYQAALYALEMDFAWEECYDYQSCIYNYQ